MTIVQAPGRRVLVVEDDRATREVLEFALTLDGHEVVQADDGVEGLRRARDARPDVLVVDWMMPSMDGITLTRYLREDPDLAGIPVVMLTARGLPADAWSGWQCGVDAYLAKPLDVDVLRSEIERVCGTVPIPRAHGEVDAGGGRTVARSWPQWVAAVCDAVAARNLRLLDVADAGGIAPSQLARVLAGRTWPELTTVVAVSALLDLDVPVLVPEPVGE